MARLKIQLPSHFSFSTTIPVRITDLNYGKHVGNDTVLSYLHELRVQFLSSYNYKELDIEGIGLIMSDAAIEFKTELFYGEIIKGYVTATDFSKVSFDLYYKLEKLSNGELVAVAKTCMVGYDYDAKKISSLPEKVKMKLAGQPL